MLSVSASIARTAMNHVAIDARMPGDRAPTDRRAILRLAARHPGGDRREDENGLEPFAEDEHGDIERRLERRAARRDGVRRPERRHRGPNEQADDQNGSDRDQRPHGTRRPE